MADKQYFPAGDAEEEKFASAVNPIGLYQNVHNGKLTGVLDPIQGDAVVRNGFELLEEGREAAMTTQDKLDEMEANWHKKANPQDEIAELQAKLAAANARLAEGANTERVRASSDQSDTAREQSQLVPAQNANPENPKAAEKAKEEADQPTQTADEQMKAAGMLDDDGKAAKQAEKDEAKTSGVTDKPLRAADNAGDQLKDAFNSGDQKKKKESK